jgi:hypothetical protein
MSGNLGDRNRDEVIDALRRLAEIEATIRRRSLVASRVFSPSLGQKCV